MAKEKKELMVRVGQGEKEKFSPSFYYLEEIINLL